MRFFSAVMFNILCKHLWPCEFGEVASVEKMLLVPEKSMTTKLPFQITSSGAVTARR